MLLERFGRVELLVDARRASRRQGNGAPGVSVARSWFATTGSGARPRSAGPVDVAALEPALGRVPHGAKRLAGLPMYCQVGFGLGLAGTARQKIQGQLAPEPMCSVLVGLGRAPDRRRCHQQESIAVPNYLERDERPGRTMRLCNGPCSRRQPYVSSETRRNSASAFRYF